MIKAFIYLILLTSTGNLFSQADSVAAINKADTVRLNFNIPVFNTNSSGEGTEAGQQEISSLLQSSRDVFTQFASFQFGAAGYRMRGYPSENQMVMINGVKLDNPETGAQSWSSWGGLNDVTKNVETNFGNTSNSLGYSAPGGYVNIDSKASLFRKGTRISYTNSNRVFRHALMITHSTGMLKSGWALTLSASTRQGNEVYRPGTSFNASAFFLSVEKQLSEKHSLNFTAFVAPIEQGRATSEQLETYQLTKTNYYNSLWGYQNGKVRNSTTSNVQRPMLMVTHTHKIDPSSRITSTAFYTFGKSELTGLNWYNAPDPRPDYYTYLPSYYFSKGDSINGNAVADKWTSDVNRRQINWDQLIATNQANLFTLPSQTSQSINTSETRARYIVENKIENLNHYGFNSVYNKRLNNLFVSIGMNGSIYSNRKYKEVNDLLGATYWLDYDMFAQNLGADPNIKQNNIEQPDKKLYKNSRFGYDYTINVHRAELWSQIEYAFKRVDLYSALTVSDSKIWREGFVANGKFPNNSKGESEKITFFNYGLKGGATYKITGKHFMTFNANTLARAPEVNNVFISPTTRNNFISKLQNEKVISADLNYLVKLPSLKLRLTAYYTQINNQVWNRIYYSDIYNTNINLIMKNIDQLHEGFELGLEKTLLTSHLLQAAIGYGRFIYTNRPTLEAWQDNNSGALFTDRVVYLKNYRLGGTPQVVTGFGYKFNAVKNWFIGLSFNYFDRIYVESNPDRRTEEAISSFLGNETEQYKKIIEQQKLPSYYTVNASAGKTFRFRRKNMLSINLSVNNILNNKNNITNGREQLRWDYSNINKFANKYSYMTGTTYMIMMNFSF